MKFGKGSGHVKVPSFKKKGLKNKRKAKLAAIRQEEARKRKEREQKKQERDQERWF